jgi:hypothetical protein
MNKDAFLQRPRIRKQPIGPSTKGQTVCAVIAGPNGFTPSPNRGLRRLGWIERARGLESDQVWGREASYDRKMTESGTSKQGSITTSNLEEETQARLSEKANCGEAKLRQRDPLIDR